MMDREKRATPTQFLMAAVLILAAVCFAACQPPEPSVESHEPISGMAPVNGVDLYYEIHGEGTPLLLLHGGLGHSGN